MGIGKGKSENIDIDSLIENIDNENKTAQEERNISEKIVELKRATAELNAAIDRMDNIVAGFNSSVKDFQLKKIGAQVHPQTLKALNEICTNFVVEVGRQLMVHRDKQLELQKEHEKRIVQMLEKSKGVWLSDKWTKLLLYVFLVYSSVTFLCLIL